jgi:hypothetical protein
VSKTNYWLLCKYYLIDFLVNDTLRHLDSNVKQNNVLNGMTSTISNNLSSLKNKIKERSTNNTENNSNRIYNSKSVPSTGYNKTNGSVITVNNGGSLSAGESPRKLCPIRLQAIPNGGKDLKIK